MNNINYVQPVIESKLVLLNEHPVEGGVAGKVALYVLTEQGEIYVLESNYRWIHTDKSCSIGWYTAYTLAEQQETEKTVEVEGIEVSLIGDHMTRIGPLDRSDVPAIVKVESLKKLHEFKYNPESILTPSTEESEK